MLSLSVKSAQDGGFLLDGEYTLAIVRFNDGRLDMLHAEREYTFHPNPTDHDYTIDIPNDIQPDQGDGFYVTRNQPGPAMINVRGTTAQYPRKTALERFGGTIGAGAQALSNMLGITDKPDGYTEYIDLKNFFFHWFALIRDAPSAHSMLWVNHKDVELYEVVPASVKFGRVSARPLQYGYGIALTVIGEHQPFERYRFRLSALDRLSRIRSKINKWRQAINQAVLMTSYLQGEALCGIVGLGNSAVMDVTNFLENVTDGFYGMTTVANSIAASGATTRERILDVVHRTPELRSPGGALQLNLDAHKAPSGTVVPPTRTSIASVFSSAGFLEAMAASVELLNESAGYSESLGVNLSSPMFDQYAGFLDIEMNRVLAEELAPLAESEVIGHADLSSRLLHEGARSGAAGYLEGRTEELTSASLSKETYLLDGVRTAKADSVQAQESVTLSYLASQVIIPWSKGHNETMSPALDSFRRAFLGMRSPGLLSPLYRSIEVQAVDTVYSLASRYLGTWERWFEIVMLNDLRDPYIAPEGGLYVKKPGEFILVPDPQARIPIQIVEDILRITKVHDLARAEDVFLGFDMEIGSDGDSVFNLNDFAHVVGAKAYIQEVSFMLQGYGGISTDPDPQLGIRIGSKSRGKESLSLWAGILKQWIVNDPRVEELRGLKVAQDSGVIRFWMNLKFAGYDDTIVLADSVTL